MLRLGILFFFLPIFIASPATSQRFIGQPIVDLSGSGDGRQVRLVKPYSFEEADGTVWRVPAGTLVDGASIPKVFWSLIGGPFEGKYRNASIIHDYYCNKKNRPWRNVHRMFYSGMIASKVDPLTAKLMYYAVFRFGPRWELKQTLVPSRGFSGAVTMIKREVAIDLPPVTYDPKRAEADLKAIEDGNLSLAQIEALAAN